MKTKINSFLKLNVIKLIMAFGMLLVISACNSTRVKDEQSNDPVKELNDLEEEVAEMVYSEKQEIISEGDSLLNVFDNKLTNYENKLDRKNEKITEETRELISDLKFQRDVLQNKLEKIGAQTEKNWESFKTDMEQDMEEFKLSLKDFFKNNNV